MNFIKILPHILFIVGNIFLILGYFGPDYIKEKQKSTIAQKLPFTRDSESFKKWNASREPGYLSLYVFNITNLEKYLNNEDPKIEVEEVGPIVYKYIPEINFFSFNDTEKVVNYHRSKTFYFEPEMSKIDLNAEIYTVNMPAVGAFDTIKKMSMITRFIGESKAYATFKKANFQVFIKVKINEIFFEGYDVTPVINLSSEAAKKFKDNKFGFMHNKNGSNDGYWSTYTGVDDINKLGTIKKYDEITLNTCWKEKCGYITGTDGTRFKPDLNSEKDKVVEMYSSSLYRSLTMGFKKEEIFKNIKIYKYEIEESNFILSLEQNKCYCVDDQKKINETSFCDINGLLDISSCRKTPIVISAPHFLFGSPELIDSVNGVKPDINIHTSYIDIDPVTGMTLRGRKRLQVNAYVTKNKLGHPTKDSFVPLFWLEEAQEISDAKAVLYYKAIYGKVNAFKIVLAIFLLTGFALIFISLVLTIINFLSKNKEKNLNGKKSDINHNIRYHKANTIPLKEKTST